MKTRNKDTFGLPLLDTAALAMSQIKCGMYQHHKGGMYLLLGVGQHTETKELLAIYVSMDAKQPGPRIRLRPLQMFLGYVTVGTFSKKASERRHKRQIQRFTYIGNGTE